MGEHGHHTILGFDRYAFNFWVLMIFTAITLQKLQNRFSMKIVIQTLSKFIIMILPHR